MSESIVGLNEAEKKAKIRDYKVEKLLSQLQLGLSVDEQEILLKSLKNLTNEEYYIGKKKKRTDGVKFVQLIMDNINYLNKIGYLKPKEEAFLFKLTPYIDAIT